MDTYFTQSFLADGLLDIHIGHSPIANSVRYAVCWYASILKQPSMFSRRLSTTRHQPYVVFGSMGSVFEVFLGISLLRATMDFRELQVASYRELGISGDFYELGIPQKMGFLTGHWQTIFQVIISCLTQRDTYPAWRFLTHHVGLILTWIEVMISQSRFIFTPQIIWITQKNLIKCVGWYIAHIYIYISLFYNIIW